VEFIETKQPGLGGERGGREPQRILVADLAAFELLAESPDALVHVGYEFMKMRSAFANDWARLEEQVHQHGLAAADLAENVEALDRILAALACAKQPAERGRFACKPMFAQPPIKRVKLPKDCLLGDIPFDLAGRDAGRVKRCDVSRHVQAKGGVRGQEP